MRRGGQGLVSLHRAFGLSSAVPWRKPPGLCGYEVSTLEETSQGVSRPGSALV